jgi:hypothetical protein
MTAYSEKTSRTIAAIRDYDDKRLIVANTPADIMEKRESLASPSSARIDGLPRVRNPHAGEERLVNALDMIDEMRGRYEKAVVFLQWFEPMWKALTEAERRVLESYKYSDVRCGMVGELAEEFNYSARHLRRTRQKALARLERLLFGD